MTRISRTTLSDWLHREAHDIARDRSRLSGGHRLRLAAELLPTAAGASGVCRLLPITMPSPPSGAHQKSGPFPPPALPGLSSNMTLSDTRRHRRLSATLRPLPSCQNGPPPITRTTIPTCRAHYPGGSDGCTCRLLPHPRGLPRYSGGSASASSLSRPAQASLALRPAGLLQPPKAALCPRGSDRAGCPTGPLVSYALQSTTLRVKSSSTGGSRLRGALNKMG